MMITQFRKVQPPLRDNYSDNNVYCNTSFHNYHIINIVKTVTIQNGIFFLIKIVAMNIKVQSRFL